MKYELKRFSCKSGCQRRDKCAKMPLEISMNGKKNVDVMFVTEFPGKEECDENRFLTGKYGIPFRNILNKLSENYHFSYAIAGLFKSKSTEDVMKTSYRSTCICRDEVLKREINFVKPKVIVVMGKYAYKFLMGKNPKYGMLVEHGRLVPANVLGHECEVVSVQHTTWYVKNDSCVIGFLYEEIRKTLDYVLKGIDYRIPNNFESVTLRTLRDVKNVFNDMKKSKQYVASDTEDDNLNIVYSNNLISLQVCNDGKTGFVIPVIHFDSPFKGRKLDELKNLIYDFYTDKSANILGHIWVNAKFDYHQLIRECKVLEINAPFIDCSFAEYSLEETWSRIRGFPHQKGHFSLFTMAYSRGFSFYDETSSKEKRTILSHLPLKEWEDYGGADVVAPWQIYQSQLRQAETQGYLHNFKKLNERFYTHMCRSTTYVEHCGLSLDYEVLQQLNSNDSIFKAAKDEVMDKFYESEFVLKANDILSKKMKGIAARGLFGTSRIFNPSKSTHRELLYFDVMNLEPVEDTDGKKENHTDKAFQKEYENIPEVSLLTEFNSIVKMQTGFVTPVATWMDKRNPDKREDFLDFRSRGSFMNDAVTGRLKCVKPNNQQRPSRGKQVNTILSMYKAPKERVCIKLDYKTFEVKGLGFMSGDKIMVSSFTEMHNLVKEFRKNPTIFTDNGYNEALGTLKDRKKELVERKKALSYLKGRDRDNAKKSYLEEVEKYKKDRAALKDSYENDRIALSMSWLTNQIDFHRKSASLFNGVSLTEVTKAMRQKAKGLVFGCFTSDTIVTTENGAYRVKNIIDNKLPVQSINCEIKDSDGAISKGEKPTVRVLTRRGVLKATSGHHVLTVSKDCTLEMKPCGLLEEKDVVVWQRGVFGDAIPQIENKNLTLEDVEAMGLFTGAGSAGIYDRQNYRIHHCSIDRKEVKKVRDFITKLSGIKPKIVKYKSKSTHVLNVKIKSYPKDMYQFSINNKKAYTKLLDFGLLGKQKVRRVPDQILRAKPEYVSAYLRGYFDADGGIRNSSKKRNQIFLSSVNYDLLYDVVYLLGMFNISSSVYRNGDYFELIITNSVSMLRFYKEIGFGTKVKQNKLKEWCKQISKDVSDKTKYPFSTKELNKKYSKHAGVNTFRSRSVYVNNTLIKPLKKPIQYVIDHIDEYHDSFMALNMKEEWDCLKLLSNKDVRLSEVFEAPVDNGIEEVFDVVNVKDYHKWVANGIVVSNSIYGRGVKSIARELGISEEEAQKYQDLFKANMPEACAWLENSQKFARKYMYVESPLGRRRRLWGYLLEDKRATSQMDRYAINTVIQGVCSDENLIASSLLISFIFAHGKAITQTTPEDAWMLTNLVHDSTEMEVPLEDLYYVLNTFESWYTTKLTYFNKKMFDFNIAIPLEVDMGVGLVYNNIVDWNGSDIHAKELQKWVIKEHNALYNDSKKAKKVMINHPFFEEYKNVDKEVLKAWCKKAV